jgi:hypothetical protein
MLAIFPFPARISLTKLSQAENSELFPDSESLVSDIPPVGGEMLTFFYSVG